MRVAVVAILSAFSLIASANLAPVAARNADRKPALIFTIINTYPDKFPPKGPLAKKVDLAMDAAKRNDRTALSTLVNPKAEALLRNGKYPTNAADLLRLFSENCHGPFLFDESNTWVQYSLICNPAPESAFGKYLELKDTSEVNLTISFTNGKISAIDGMERLTPPMAQKISLNAYEALKADK